VNVAFLRHLLAGGYVPVISPVSSDGSGALGGALNVNGDDAAAAIAVALGAAELLLVADVEGVMRDGNVISRLSPEEARGMLANGTAAGGMRAKLQAGLTALDGGVARVRISDIAAIADRGRGTSLQKVGDLL
jgi:acetylglutamate kinase